MLRGDKLMQRTAMKPYRPTVTTDDRKVKEDTRLRFEGWCEVRSPWCKGRATNYQHRLPTGRLGPTTMSNGLAVCGNGNLDGCHGYIHQHPELATQYGWTLPTNADPAAEQTLIHTSNYGHDWVLLREDGGIDLAPFPPPAVGDPFELPVTPRANRGATPTTAA